MIQVSRLKIQGVRTPFSERFQDVYFAEDSGIDESNFVYLQGTELEARLRNAGARTHSIGEIGFGVGLNFLLTLRLFKKASREDQKLYYYSAEQYPVHAEDLVRLYCLYPELKTEADELLEQYPVLTPGIHALRFCEGRVTLFLMLGSAEKMYQQIETPIDTWYWDGFAPSKNADAFSESLFQVLARTSAPGARGSSFTAAGWVRRGLESAGFTVVKRGGFGKKRECIQGIYEGTATPSSLPVWFSNQSLQPANPAHDRVAVVGAGLAGSAAARALARRGFEVTVFDPNGIATRASGNKAGLFNIQISRLPNPISRYAQAALIQFLAELKTLQIDRAYGILRADTGDLKALQNSHYPEDFYQLRSDGLFLPQCGFLNPVELCRERLNHPKIKVLREMWTLARRSEFDHVVYAQGADLSIGDEIEHPVLKQLPVRPIRGQILEVAPSVSTRDIATTRVHHAYLTPIRPEIKGNNAHWLGATYQAKDILVDQEQVDRDFLIHEARRSWPEFESVSVDQVLSHRVGYRLSTPDKLPLIGPLADPADLKLHYERALKGARIDSLPPLPSTRGEWCLLGLGSRGITYSALGAEILASCMVGDPLPIELDLWPHLHSLRFFIRNLRKN